MSAPGTPCPPSQPTPAGQRNYNNMIQEMKPYIFKAFEQENAKEE